MDVGLCYSEQLADVNIMMLRILAVSEGAWWKISKRAQQIPQFSKAGQ